MPGRREDEMLRHVPTQGHRCGVILNEVKDHTQVSLITQSEQRILGFDCEVPRSLGMTI
jgi:hypothetical protein